MTDTTNDTEILPEEVRKTVEEVVEEKKKQWMAEAEERIRREMIERYEADREQLIGKVDRLVTEALSGELAALREAWQRRLRRAVAKGVATERAKLTEMMDSLRAEAKLLEERAHRLAESQRMVDRRRRAVAGEIQRFVREQLERELTEFQEDRRALLEQRAAVEGERRRLAEASRRVLAEALGRMRRFVTENLKRELSEFEKDRRALEERRIVLERDAHRRLAEARREFVRRATKVVERGISESLKRELGELREDILEARRNTLGRRLYEAFVAEWTLSGGAEKGAAKSLAHRLAEERKARRAYQRALLEQQQAASEAEQRARLAEAQLVRQRKLEHLLQPLTGRKREIMRSLLESVETERLEDAFRRFVDRLGSIEDGRPATPRKAARLDESAAAPVVTAVEVRTGDREAGPGANDEDIDLAKLQRLAGILQ